MVSYALLGLDGACGCWMEKLGHEFGRCYDARAEKVSAAALETQREHGTLFVGLRSCL
jgi:hypothetical protein